MYKYYINILLTKGCRVFWKVIKFIIVFLFLLDNCLYYHARQTKTELNWTELNWFNLQTKA